MNIELDEKTFDEIYKHIQNIYNTCVVLKVYFDNFEEIEEIVNVTPVIKYLGHESDKACYSLFNISREYFEEE